jgi:hypothetical protein
VVSSIGVLFNILNGRHIFFLCEKHFSRLPLQRKWALYSVALALKGLSHEIFMVIFWLEWIYIGLKGNRFWFLNFKDVSSILDSNFKY